MENKKLIENTTPDDRFIIVGYGTTGQAVAKFFDSKNFQYYVVDDHAKIQQQGTGMIEHIETSKALKLMAQKSIKAVLPSPGVSLKHPVIAQAQEKNIPLIGELELASFFLKGDFIAVTGTNGKSTTVRLISALLEEAGIKNKLCGNIGTPLISAVNEPPVRFYVIEESSYQLELVGSLRHHIAICLNVTEDHFDRYENIHEYALAKQLIIKNSRNTDWFLFNDDDLFCKHMSQSKDLKKVPFSLAQHYDKGAYWEKDQLIIKLYGQTFSFNTKACNLQGLHNFENMLAALTAVLIVDHSPQACASYAETLQNFVGLTHRMQKVHSENGVDYIDDSKATNVGAVAMALAGYENNVILIAGGKNKHCDFSPLKGLVHHKVKHLVLIGEVQDIMYDVLKNETETTKKTDMRQAVAFAKEIAQPGDVVLLSPACSSYDQYKNFEERGRDFSKWVKQL